MHSALKCTRPGRRRDVRSATVSQVRRILVVLTVMGAIAACGSDATGSTESTAGAAQAPTTAAVTEPPVTEPAVTEPEPVLGEELVGRWAHYDVVAYEDDVLKTLIISYGFNDFTEVDGQIVDQSSFCFSEQRTDQPIITSLSDAATQAIQPPPAVLEIDTVDGVLRVQRPPTPTPVGIRLDDPFNEPLPTDPNDPRIVDDDGDGKPGLTVTIEVTPEFIGELYIARREIFAFEAFLTEPDLLTGQVTDDSEQLVIGASDPVFASSPANWGQYPDLSKSPIILRHVDADWDCERLAAERDDLFPPTPDVDW
jgi:hypothetical protein